MAFAQIFNEWESKYDIFNKGHVDDFDFYGYMHREFVNEIYDSLQNVDRNLLQEGEAQSSLQIFSRLIKNRRTIKEKNPSLLVLNHSRKNIIDGKYECPFTDFLSDFFPDAVYLERPNKEHSHLSPALQKNLYYTDIYLLKAYIYRILSKTLFPKKYKAVFSEIKNIMDEPINALERDLGIKIKRNSYYDRSTCLYYFYKVKKKDYSKLLDTVRPKAVVMVVGGSFDACLMNELCREKNIPSIEMQHCLLSVSAQFPKNIIDRQFAQYYLTYSDYWKEYARFPIPEENVISCGSANYEKQTQAYLDKRSKSEKKRIVFLSGPGYGRALSLLAVELNRLAGHEIEITYKLHPAEFSTWKTDYTELKEEGIRVIDTKEIGLYACFADADAQIGVFSTAIYEGLGFKLDTYIYNLPYAGEFIDFCKDGYGRLIDDASMLYQELMNPKTGLNEDISSWFWKKNARENVANAIKEISGVK